MANPPSNLPFEPVDDVRGSALPVPPPASPKPPVAPMAPPPLPTPATPVPMPPRAPMPPAAPKAPTPSPIVAPPAVPPKPFTPPAPRPPASMMAERPQPEIKAMPTLEERKPAPTKGEPEDIFNDLESKAKKPTPAPIAAPVRSSEGGSVMKFVFIGVGLVLFIALVGFIFWMIFINKPAVEPTDVNLPVVPPPVTTETVPEVVIPETPATTEAPTTSETNVIVLPPPVTTTPPGTNIPPPSAIGEPTPEPPAVDSDNDGLSDQREVELGLDPRNPDMDGDGVLDGDEVDKYKTNPTNADTDGDGYTDGVEISGGYNPRGAGKCSVPDCTATL